MNPEHKNHFSIFAILLFCILFLDSCTLRTFYLSSIDHIPAFKSVYNWKENGADSGFKARLDSHVIKINGVHSFLIVRNDSLLYEWYAKGFNAKTAHNLKSASKSILSLLTGIAIQSGYLRLDSDIKHIFTGVDMDSLTGKVTIEQLLTMKGGFPSGGYLRMVCASLNPIESTLKKRVSIKPNDSAVYSDIGGNLLGYAVAKSANMKLEDLAHKKLFTPLGIHSAVWVQDSKGNDISAGDIFLCPRDLARIGYLVIHKGKIEEQQIISEEWIENSTSPKTDVAGIPSDLRYGFLWWIDKNNDCKTFAAIGYGGQILYVSPSDSIVFVMTSSWKSNNWHSSIELIRSVLQEIRSNYNNHSCILNQAQENK